MEACPDYEQQTLAIKMAIFTLFSIYFPNLSKRCYNVSLRLKWATGVCQVCAQVPVYSLCMWQGSGLCMWQASGDPAQA